jgi:hypothetical protein
MKRIILLLALIKTAQIVNGQDLRKNIIKVDTVPGHGYEVMYMVKPIKKDVVETFNNGPLLNGKKDKRNDINKTVSENFYRPVKYNWKQTQNISDSLTKLNENWRLPTLNQLKTIFNKTKDEMNTHAVRLGSLEWQGIFFLYWCNNGSYNPINEESIYAAGSENGREFGYHPLTGKSLIDSDDPQIPDYKVRFYLLFIKSY